MRFRAASLCAVLAFTTTAVAQDKDNKTITLTDIQAAQLLIANDRLDDAKRIKRVQRTAEWIMQIFSPRRFPWFRDEFIHPDQFAEVYKGGPLTNRVADLQVPR
jgi:hypothetical protein